MSNSIKNDSGCNKEKLISATVRLPESVYLHIKKLSEEFNESFSSVVRFAVEGELKKYLGTVRYINQEQATEILTAVNELTCVCRVILNEVRRIGVNFNQEIRLKNAYKKYVDIQMQKNVSIDKIYRAKEEYDAEIKEINNTCLDKKELDDILTRFEKNVDKVEELLWHIQK